MKLRFKKSILEVSPYVPGKPIAEVQRELGLEKVIKLASNENPYPPSPKVLQAIESAAKDVARYPASDCYYLRKALAEKWNISPSSLIFGNGSDELIVLAVRALVEPGDEIVLAKPSFLIYSIASQLEGAELKQVPLKGFCYDLEEMARQISAKTKIVFLGNPDNPAGTYFKEHQMRTFLKKVPEETLVFIDEAYYEYVDEEDYVDSVKLLSEFQNVIVTRTFSKMYGLAALRIGYGMACEEIVQVLNRLREPFNVNSLAQAAALACLEDREYYREISHKVVKEREFLMKELTALGVPFQKSWTNFLLLDVGEGNKVSKALMQEGVIVRDMSVWGLNRYIRVTLGSREENEAFIDALKETL